MENQESIYEEKQGNLLTGILGALLGALIGTALWVLVGVWGYIAGIVAWLTAFLAGKGYDLLHGRPGKAKAITIIVMLILSICVGTVGTATVIMVQSYNQQISEMNTFEQARIQKYGPTVEEYVQSMFMEQDVQTEIVKNLAVGMLFGALGANNINIRMIAQGSEEISIIVGVDNKDFERTIRTLYDGFMHEGGSKA